MLTEDEMQANIQAQVDRGRDLLETMRSKGVPVDSPQALEHVFWSAVQRDGALLGRELASFGYLIVALKPHEGDDGSQFWNLVVERERTPIEAASRDLAELLVRLAARFDSIYDGWGRAAI
jgi:hypothetical protein